MHLDNGFFERAEMMRDRSHLSALKDAVSAVPSLAGAGKDAQTLMAAAIDQIWSDASALGLHCPVSTQKYVLIHMTRARWRNNPAHLAFVARMIGTPNQNWRMESGVLAVYQNVVAAHYLIPALTAFIAKEELKL